MAKKNALDPDDFPAPLAGSGFTNIPMPPQSVVDQMAAAASQPTPEEILDGPLYVAPRRVDAGGRTIKDIIDEFMAAITSHPDAKMMTSAFGGTPTQQQQFTDTPLRLQHRVELRFVYRDPQAAYEQTPGKPWKWAFLCPQKEEAQQLAGRAAEASVKRETVPS